MTHDLLKLAELNEMAAEGHDDIHADLDRESAAALRAAHEELRTAREAYTNIGSERDNLLLECENLRGKIARLRKEIEDAPIGDQCDGMQCIRIFEEWQSKALGDHNGTI